MDSIGKPILKLDDEILSNETEPVKVKHNLKLSQSTEIKRRNILESPKVDL